MGGLLARLAEAGAMEHQGADDAAADVIYLWPECVEAWRHWQALQTQWRYGGAGGATGLDYAGVRAYIDEQGIRPRAQRRELFACIQACEAASLDAWAESRSRQQPPPRGA